MARIWPATAASPPATAMSPTRTWAGGAAGAAGAALVGRPVGAASIDIAPQCWIVSVAEGRALRRGGELHAMVPTTKARRTNRMAAMLLQNGATSCART